MNNPIISIIFLLICLKLAKYWFPTIGKIIRWFFRLLKEFLSFCWTRKPKTTGAKRTQPKVNFRR